MRGNYAEFLLVLGLLSIGTTLGSDLNVQKYSEVRCKPDERKALLKFNQGLGYPLDSWNSEEDCCKWEAIECSEQTGHVVKLDLSQRGCDILVSSSLLELQHLTYLDLSGNRFVAGNFLAFIGSLTNLQYLNLSGTNLNGTIPQNLRNLSSLFSLDLSLNLLAELRNLDWLPNLSWLRHLDLSGVNLSQAVNWPSQVDMLPSLLDLHLRGCGLSMPQISSAISPANFTSPLSIP
ncbi:Polygalacturonase inhibitor [Morella rubra]|uniref:Polygalacturonase inhibitor n=1 Tax=Morella rubra TaxID=262757 RepID=A0A6A1UX89_9ROSI|nr:Polygalacturonase inhibitor [Morella rubra]